MPTFRYPGPFPFDTDEEEIFFGRDTDIDRLYTKILANQTVLLHARSGTGKSSLINAGVLPELKRNNPEYVPVVIRFEGIKKDENQSLDLKDRSDDALIKEIISEIKPHLADTNAPIPYLMKQENDLWYLAKRLQKSEKSLLLIFDQFENIESYEYEQIATFKKKLSQLFNPRIPAEYYQYFKENSPAFSNAPALLDSAEESDKYNTEAAFIKEPLDSKALFIVKDEKLGVMSSLSDFFPDILKNDYILQMLDLDGAKSAIKTPAGKQGDFVSPRIDFDEGAIEYLIDNLKNASTGRIDPLEIQIICSYVEKKIIEDFKEKKLKPDPEKGMVTISKEYFPPITDIVNFFYNDCWDTVRPPGASAAEFEKMRGEIIRELVVEGNRIPVYLNNFSKEKRSVIINLEKTGLVRKTIFDGKDFYQLCHDRFIKPLLEDKSKLEAETKAFEEKLQLENALKKAQEEKNRIKLETKLKQIEEENQRIAIQNDFNQYIIDSQIKSDRTNRRTIRWLLISLALVLLATTFAVYSYFKAKKSQRLAQESRYLLISTVLRPDNPTLAYVMAKNWFKENEWSDTMKKYLASYDTSNYVYLQGIYPAKSEIASATMSSPNSLIIKEDSVQSVWSVQNRTFIRTEKNAIPDRSISYAGGRVKLAVAPNVIPDRKRGWLTSIELKDTAGSLIGKGTVRFGFDDTNIRLSDNARFLFVEDSLYAINDKTISEIPLPKYEVFDETISQIKPYERVASLFLDNDRIAVGYGNGDILVYEINNGSKNRLTRVATIQQQDEFGASNPIPIISMAMDTKHRFLFAANSQNGIGVWDLSFIRKEKSTHQHESHGDKDSIPFITELVGHRGSITCFIFSSTDKALLTGSSDFSAILWDISSRDIKKIAALKGPNSSEIKSAGFFNNDRDIATVTYDKVYLWKNGIASTLYEEDQLYRFSRFDYASVSAARDWHQPDTVTTKDFYNATLNYYLNLPEPNDKGTGNSLPAFVNEARSMHDDLIKRKDYPKKTYQDSLLNIYYERFLPRIERDIIKAGNQITQWEAFFSDTLKNKPFGARLASTSVSPILNSYIVRQNNYVDGLRLIKFYNDSVWKPLRAKYGENYHLQLLKRNIDVYWLQYYLFTGKQQEALKLASDISHYFSKSINNKIYLVATDLAANKYDEASTLYRDIQVEKGMRRINSDRTLLNVLKRLREKNIAVSSIDRFITEVHLRSIE